MVGDIIIEKRIPLKNSKNNAKKTEPKETNRKSQKNLSDEQDNGKNKRENNNKNNPCGKDEIKINDTNGSSDANNKSSQIKPRCCINNTWLPFVIIITSVLLILLISFLLGGSLAKFKSAEMPEGTIPYLWYVGLWISMQLEIGLATYLFWKQKNKFDAETIVALVTLSISLILSMFWPLFFFRFNLEIVGVILIGISAIASIYLTYLYYRRSLPAGILCTMYSLWLIYLFYINWGYVLISI